jgi:serine/threonine protein kinase
LSSPSGYSSSSSLSPPSSEHEENIFSFSPYSKSAHSQSLNSLIPTRRLKSIVGSPHYIAPEIINSDQAGYDGSKVDMWSSGVILYALLIGKHPFGSDLSSCPHFQRYKRWSLENSSAIESGKAISVPSWFFPSWITPLASSLIISLLQCDPSKRPTAADALLHPWCLGGSSASSLRELVLEDESTTTKYERLTETNYSSTSNDDENVIVVCENFESLTLTKPVEGGIQLSPIRTSYLNSITEPSYLRGTSSSRLSPTNSKTQLSKKMPLKATNTSTSNSNDSDDNDSDFITRINKQRLQKETNMMKDLNKPDNK